MPLIQVIGYQKGSCSLSLNLNGLSIEFQLDFHAEKHFIVGLITLMVCGICEWYEIGPLNERLFCESKEREKVVFSLFSEMHAVLVSKFFGFEVYTCTYYNHINAKPKN